MKTNNLQGRTLATAIGVYLIAKSVLNMIIGGGFSLGDLLLSVGMAFMLTTGLQFVNIVIAGILLIVAVVHLPANISNFGNNWFYLIEGIIDIVCAVFLVTKDSIKEHFTNRWNDIKDVFGK